MITELSEYLANLKAEEQLQKDIAAYDTLIDRVDAICDDEHFSEDMRAGAVKYRNDIYGKQLGMREMLLNIQKDLLAFEKKSFARN